MRNPVYTVIDGVIQAAHNCGNTKRVEILTPIRDSQFIQCATGVTVYPDELLIQFPRGIALTVRTDRDSPYHLIIHSDDPRWTETIEVNRIASLIPTFRSMLEDTHVAYN